ncbi:helix-turn-helix domain-containing protein [Paraburkholderia sp. SIMBA_030]|uniref:helix-turn-helix domain-containing protein n=1 Tax=Paraburkholderia sp. SIMBA_030 TaxID=3085773 RepID=UPI0039784647
MADTATHQRIVALRGTGQTIKRTAELTGCSESQVKRIWAIHLANSDHANDAGDNAPSGKR